MKRSLLYTVLMSFSKRILPKYFVFQYYCICFSLPSSFYKLRLLRYMRAGRSRLRITVEARDFSFLRNVKAHPASYSVGTGVLLRVKGGRGLKLTTHLQFVPRLGMSGAMPLLLICVRGVDREIFTFTCRQYVL